MSWRTSEKIKERNRVMTLLAHGNLTPSERERLEEEREKDFANGREMLTDKERRKLLLLIDAYLSIPGYDHTEMLALRDKISRINKYDVVLPPRLATVKQACAYAKMSATLLYERIGDGRLVTYKRVGRTLVDLDSIDRLNAIELKPWTPSRKRQEAAE